MASTDKQPQESSLLSNTLSDEGHTIEEDSIVLSGDGGANGLMINTQDKVLKINKTLVAAYLC